VKRNSLNKMPLFGFLQLYSRKEVEEIVENLLSNNLLEYQQLPENRFIKVIAVTEKGKRVQKKLKELLKEMEKT